MKEAKTLTAELNNPLQKQNRAYAKIIHARIAALSKQPAAALDTLHEATKLADLWLARYQLGLTYAQAGAWSEALSEFAMCERRRGEATALFLDDVPTIRYLAALPYGWAAPRRASVSTAWRAPAFTDSFQSEARVFQTTHSSSMRDGASVPKRVENNRTQLPKVLHPTVCPQTKSRFSVMRVPPCETRPPAGGCASWLPSGRRCRD